MLENHCLPRDRRPSLLQLQLRGAEMKRDDELLRKLMLEIEADPEPLVLYDSSLNSGHEARLEYYHLRLLADDGFLEETGRHGGIFRITSAGHDFIGMMNDEGMWINMKKKAAAVVPRYGIRLLFEVGNSIARQKMRDMGLPLD